MVQLLWAVLAGLLAAVLTSLLTPDKRIYILVGVIIGILVYVGGLKL